MASALIIPGDTVPVQAEETAVVIGPGIQQDVATGRLIPTQAGVLTTQHRRNTELVYVEANVTKYVPQANDFVVGTVTGSFGEFFKVEISRFSPPAILSMMAFPNASKKNRPNLTKGDLVYARVAAVNPDIDVDLECFDATTGKDGGFGPLDGGCTVDVGLAYARWLLSARDNALLEKLSAFCKFEIAVGLNGKIWLKCDDLKTTLCCANVVAGCQTVPKDQVDAYLKAAFKTLS